MTSAPNHRLRLNGSKLTVLLLLGFLAACTTTKTGSGKTPGPAKPPVHTQNEDHVPAKDPSSDPVEESPDSKVDTVQWKEDPAAPIVDDTKAGKGHTIKAVPEIDLLLPLNGLQTDFTLPPDPRQTRFIQFYAGARLAAQYLDSIGLDVKIKSFDTQTTTTSLSDLMTGKELLESDVIVGPYEKEDMDKMASFGLAHEKMVVSPWLPAFTPEEENPFFLQLNPGLATHAQAIVEFIKTQWPGDQVYIVARDHPAELNRIQTFKKAGELTLEELIIKDESPDLGNTNLLELLDEHGRTIFILPYYLRADETFVNSFLRKLHADKDTREVIVFGLPQWMGYSNLNANYLESLSVHLSISSYTDIAHPAYAWFRNKFFQTYHQVPDLNAFQGYDLVIWLANQLKVYGQEGLIGYRNPSLDGMSMGFDMRPVYTSTETTTEEMKSPAYYENTYIRIVRFYQQDYILVR